MSKKAWQWKTWHAENAAVASVLLAVWLASGHKPVELLGSVAVFCGFCHASISERLREREAARAVPSVECHRKSVWFFCLKEVAWLAYFLVQGSWSALVGCAVFALYPLWRRLWRKHHPLRPEVVRDVEGQVRD